MDHYFIITNCLGQPVLLSYPRFIFDPSQLIILASPQDVPAWNPQVGRKSVVAQPGAYLVVKRMMWRFEVHKEAIGRFLHQLLTDVQLRQRGSRA